MRGEDNAYTLGLDIGIASVGAALLGDDRVIALFVRTFDKAETAKEGESLNKIRRDARQTRRRIRRRAHRLLRLRRMFKRVGILPSADLSLLVDSNIRPWQLRSEGLDRQMSPTEWAAVLYHIIKHRGFHSNRKSEATADEKNGQMLAGVDNNHSLLQNYRSIGDMVHKDERFRVTKRNKGGDYSHTFSRADIAAELTLLFSRQKELSNPYANEQIKAFVENLLFSRRPALSGDSLLKMVGRCTFEPTEYRAPKASYTAERFVWLTKLNNLRISGVGTTYGLTEDQREVLIDLPFKQAKLTYKQVRKKLNLPNEVRFAGLDYRGDKDPETATFFEAKSYHALRKAYESAGLEEFWRRDSQNSQRLDALSYALTVFKEDNEIRNWLIERGLELEIVETVLALSFSNFIRLSIKALYKILPHMQVGMRYDEAVVAAGYMHHSQPKTTSKAHCIPCISKEDIANPVVYRALNQARKMVNAIVRKYGPPNAVHIELARDLNKSFEERKKIEKEQKKYRENKESDLAEYIRLFPNTTPHGQGLQKFRLYREQLAQCPYCQQSFNLTRLYEPGYAEVDHALPYSRSFDNGMNNKVLICTKHNRDKGNRTPYEFLGGASYSPEWQRFVAWVMSNHNYRQAKRQRLLRKEFSKDASEKFKERNLSDTRYACSKFKQMVETHLQLAEDSNSKRCVVVSGQLTAFLRARWGLLKIRGDGDLHHALDAAVVAACSESMVKRLADYSRRNELNFVRKDFVDPETGEVLDLARINHVDKYFPQPWEGFRRELEARLSPAPASMLPSLTGVEPVRVSRAPNRRGTGSAHQETIRSTKHLAEGVSSVKTPLKSLSLKDLANIVGYGDPRNKALMEAIEKRLRDNNDKGDKAFKSPLYRPAPPGREHLAPIVRSVHLMDTQKSGLILTNRGNGIANNGDMLRVDIFTKGGKYFAIPLYVADATRKELPNCAVVGNKSEKEWIKMDDSYTFLFSLHKNDWLKISFRDNPLIEGYFAGLDRSTGAISILAHDRSRTVGKDGLIRSIGIRNALSLEKYHVDILGNIYFVRNEKRKPLFRK